MVRNTRKGGRKRKHGGNIVGGLLGAIKKALPSYLLYQAVKMQQKKKQGKSRRGRKSRKGGRKSRKGGRKRRKGGRKSRKGGSRKR